MADDHHRVSPAGRSLGRITAKAAELGRKRLAEQSLGDLGLPGLRDEMCASCACRAGTVPNGCLQTQLDLLKTVVDGQPFMCHAPKDGRICAGWAGVRTHHVARPLPDEVVAIVNGWEYSPPDEVPSNG